MVDPSTKVCSWRRASSASLRHGQRGGSQLLRRLRRRSGSPWAPARGDDARARTVGTGSAASHNHGMTCGNCGAENRAGRKFCAECGTPLSQACHACGAANEPGEKFCGECGTALTAQAASAPVQVADEPASERRLVSVLFADLVGHTSFSESRDAEDVRELLSRYFETARTVIERYGGTVEKFIGDAVMAVWGTPVAQEDDAERAVRAALELVTAVPQLDPGLRARAGVVTREAAAAPGAEGQGLVAGDLVNTGSRVQSVAE